LKVKLSGKLLTKCRGCQNNSHKWIFRGMYTVDAVATIVTKQQVDKAVLLFRLLNGNWMQYNAGLDSNLL